MKNANRHEPLNTPIKATTISDVVYTHIKNAIIMGDFAPGERIVQEDLTQQLQVSRTPVRDALQRLSTEGLVVIKPFYGAMVFELSYKNLHEIYEVRILIEQFAASKAIGLISEGKIEELREINRLFTKNRDSIQDCMAYDRSFHSELCAASQSEFIIEVLTSMWNKCDPYKSIYYTIDGNIDKTIDEHNEILNCLDKRDEDGLVKSIENHLYDVVNNVSYHLKQTD